ncbi:DNA-binding protein [Patescibacteria group bacterium]|nr:DNA-binding protein [Patescibacteria group bacterium]
MNETPMYVDEKFVAKMIGRAIQSLRNDRMLGKGIPYYKNGKSIRYCLEDVVFYMESRRIETINNNAK